MTGFSSREKWKVCSASEMVTRRESLPADVTKTRSTGARNRGVRSSVF